MLDYLINYQCYDVYLFNILPYPSDHIIYCMEWGLMYV